MSFMMLIDLLFANKWLMAAIAAFMGAALFYVRGYSSGKTSEKDKGHAAWDELQKRLREIDSKNIKVDREREKDANTVNSANTIDDLISLWDKNNQGPGSDSK